MNKEMNTTKKAGNHYVAADYAYARCEALGEERKRFFYKGTHTHTSLAGELLEKRKRTDAKYVNRSMQFRENIQIVVRNH